MNACLCVKGGPEGGRWRVERHNIINFMNADSLIYDREGHYFWKNNDWRSFFMGSHIFVRDHLTSH